MYTISMKKLYCNATHHNEMAIRAMCKIPSSDPYSLILEHVFREYSDEEYTVEVLKGTDYMLCIDQNEVHDLLWYQDHGYKLNVTKLFENLRQ